MTGDDKRLAGPAALTRPMNVPAEPAGMRLDKWLWAARMFKTRALAAECIDKGRVQVNGQVAKRARDLRAGDRVALRQGERGEMAREFQVLALSATRGPAAQAQRLYAETPASIAAREQEARQRAYHAEPAQAIEQGRPTKRDRRELAAWQRWSASVDD
jgi:ribosome-associated heat shock protein Hsp15